MYYIKYVILLYDVNVVETPHIIYLYRYFHYLLDENMACASRNLSDSTGIQLSARSAVHWEYGRVIETTLPRLS